MISSLISIHAPRAGRDIKIWVKAAQTFISIHAPRAGRDFSAGYVRGRPSYFNPRAPCGARLLHLIASAKQSDFNPRAPCGARQSLQQTSGRLEAFQSTRPVRGATLSLLMRSPPCLNFNPRAPCGARLVGRLRPPQGLSISIHAPRAGRDPAPVSSDLDNNQFQSTRPVRGATPSRTIQSSALLFQSTRPVRGATRMMTLMVSSSRFQSTRPVRGATRPDEQGRGRADISIHAPRAGRDSKSIQNYFTHFCDKRQFLDNFTQNAAF